MSIIYVNSKDTIYTDFDWCEEKRVMKLNLIGCDDIAFEHPISDLNKIVSQSTEVEVYNPTDLVDDFTFAFEVIINNVDSELLRKVEFPFKFANISWNFDSKIKRKTHKAILEDIEGLETIIEGSREVSEVTAKRYITKIAYISWARMFNDKSKLENNLARLQTQYNELNRSQKLAVAVKHFKHSISGVAKAGDETGKYDLSVHILYPYNTNLGYANTDGYKLAAYAFNSSELFLRSLIMEFDRHNSELAVAYIGKWDASISGDNVAVLLYKQDKDIERFSSRLGEINGIAELTRGLNPSGMRDILINRR